MLTTVYSPSARVLATLVLAAALCACDAGSLATQPLIGGAPISVALSTTTSSPTTDLPRFQLVALTGEIDVHWDVESAPCLIAEATGAQAGSVIEIQVHRSGNPLANCANVRVGYHYVARVTGVAPGRYEVRLIDAGLGAAPYEAGRGTVVVPVAS